MKKLICALALGLTSVAALAQASAPQGYAPLDVAVTDSATEEVHEFEIKQGASLKDTLNAWAQTAGWKPVIWDMPAKTDFISGKSLRMQGTFTKVTTAVVVALRSQAELKVEFDKPNKRVTVRQVIPSAAKPASS